MVGATKLPENFQYFIEGIEAFAKLLVLRMANARAAMLFSAEEAQRLRHKQRILERLAAGPLDSRTIYRTLHLSASLCGDLLLELEADRLIQRDGAHWQRLEGAILTSGLNQPPLIA